ncbi:hypothetical protein [Nocardia wallacei]|uniref:hypothetical protein n=1 Tax=Nocardia wallacei TaxID=480035 RepID=UPI002457E8DD|nr:hypothetical protein [Nocardia wallacei]
MTEEFGSVNPVGKTYKPTRFMRHPLTRKNQRELKVPDRAPALCEKWKSWEKMEKKPPGWERIKARAQQKTADGQDRWIAPVGFSLNKVRYGDFPDDEATAHQREWYTYMNMGVPLIEERSDIQQPPPDVIYQNTFVNRTDPKPVTWTATVEFLIANEISWQLQGQVQLTFAAKTTASLQQQLQKSMAASESQTTTMKNSRDNVGVDNASQTQTTNTTTATGTATGTGELSAQLMLGITSSIGGKLTTQFRSSLQLSGKIDTRAVVRATQRRKISRFDYELPITFGGYIALYYDEPVEFGSLTSKDRAARRKAQTRDDSGRTEPEQYYQIIAHDIDVLELIEDGREYLSQKGEAEIVSTFAGEMEVFELESLTLSDGVNEKTEAYLYKE